MRLFVYGTLRSGLGEDPSGCRLAESRPRLGPGWIHGRLFDLGEFPVAVPDRSRRIHGEIYEVGDDPAYWSRLDHCEDYKPGDLESSHFLRREVPVTMENGQRLPAQVYWYRFSVDGLVEIAGGDYLAWWNASRA